MFGFSSFAAAPFAATGNNQFSSAISETASGVDTEAAFANFASRTSETASGVDTPGRSSLFGLLCPRRLQD